MWQNIFSMGLKKVAAEDFAKMLFLDTSQKLTNKEIAERIGVRPNTVSSLDKERSMAKITQIINDY